MFLILISLIFNLNAYADTLCTAKVSEGDQITPSSVTVAQGPSSDEFDSFIITTTMIGVGAQVVDIPKPKPKPDNKNSSTTTETIVPEIEKPYTSTVDQIMKLKDGSVEEFHTKRQILNITIDGDIKACPGDSLAILLYAIDNFNI